MPRSSELPVDLAVSAFVRYKLLVPEIGIGLRIAVAFPACMPEAPVYEYCDPMVLKVKIGAARDMFWMNNPATYCALSDS
jgi:hypothetical protein